MKSIRTLLNTTSLGALLIAGFILPSAARAEPMDYGSLQDLFGEPVTVSATGTPQRASDVAANMTIITADQIRRAGTRNIPQIVGIYVPGIDVIEESNGNFEVGVRGYQQAFQPRLLVLVDGRQVFIDDYSRTNWNNIPVNIDDIRQIEVVKGPSSAMFGSNAAAGAINIVTFSANYDKNRVATLSGGTQGAIGADGTVTLNGTWGGFKLSGGARDQNEFTTAAAPFDGTVVDPKHRYLVVSGVFNATRDLHLNFELTYSESKQTNSFPNGGLVSEYARAYSVRGGFDWDTKLGTIISDTYYNHSYSAFGATATSSATLPKTDLIVSKLEDRFTLGSHHTFRVMFEYRSKQLSIVNSRLGEDAVSAGGSWLWQITDALSWTNAVRFDHLTIEQHGQLVPTSGTNANFDHGIDGWSANSGLAYKAGPKDTIRVTYGRGIIMPSLLQSGTESLIPAPPIGIVSVLGNTRLAPTIVQNVELGHDHRFNSLDSTLRTSVFYTHNHDLLGTPGPVGTVVEGGTTYLIYNSPNIGGSRALGAEIGLSGQNARGFHWDVSYSYVHVKDQTSVYNSVAYSNSSPEHHVRLSGGYSAGPWEVDANVQYLSQRSVFRPVSIAAAAPAHSGGYVTVGGRIAYTIADRYILAVTATELNHDEVLETAYPAIERQVLATLTSHF